MAVDKDFVVKNGLQVGYAGNTSNLSVDHGVITTPTRPSGTNDTSVATTEFANNTSNENAVAMAIALG
jgi:ribose 1,5-bisphosphokinase PhnN